MFRPLQGKSKLSAPLSDEGQRVECSQYLFLPETSHNSMSHHHQQTTPDMTATANNTEKDGEETTFPLGETLTAKSSSEVTLQVCRKDGFKRHCPSSPETTVIGVCLQEASLPKLIIRLDGAFPTPDSIPARKTIHDAQTAIGSAACELCSQASGKLRTEDKTWQRQIFARQGDWTVSSLDPPPTEGFMERTKHNERSDVTRPGEGESQYVIVNFEVSYEPKDFKVGAEQEAAEEAAAQESPDQDRCQ